MKYLLAAGALLALAGCVGPWADTPLPPGVTPEQAAACRLKAKEGAGGGVIGIADALALNAARTQRVYQDCLKSPPTPTGEDSDQALPR